MKPVNINKFASWIAILVFIAVLTGMNFAHNHPVTMDEPQNCPAHMISVTLIGDLFLAQIALPGTGYTGQELMVPPDTQIITQDIYHNNTIPRSPPLA